MPTDAQDTHIMKAHLRKREVFHNIASAPENVVFNNSLGDRKRGSQHLVETSFQRLEDTDMRKIKTGEFPDAGWLVGWLGTPNPSFQRRRPLHPRGDRRVMLSATRREIVAEMPSATPGGIVAEVLSAPPGRRSREKHISPSPAIPTLNRSHEKHAPPSPAASTLNAESTFRHPQQRLPSRHEGVAVENRGGQ